MNVKTVLTFQFAFISDFVCFLRNGYMNVLMEKLVVGKGKFELIGSMLPILQDFAFCYLPELVVLV